MTLSWHIGAMRKWAALALVVALGAGCLDPMRTLDTQFVLIGAGDIASCSSLGDEETAARLDEEDGVVFTLGDNAYPHGSDADYANCYNPTWGRQKWRTRPVPGNHEYETDNGNPYFNYFGAAAGPFGRGYYSYDLGTWHIIVLDSSIDVSAGSVQEQWLRSDLATHRNACALAMWHFPWFSSGNYGREKDLRPLWQALYEYGADVILNGHEHFYERFAPQTPDGGLDPDHGIREFVVGTGGNGHNIFGTVAANSEKRDRTCYGLLKLTLFDGSYTWEFLAAQGGRFFDHGTGACH
jgi:hypothetical protein